MLRIPGRLLDEEVLDPYCTDDGFCFYRAADAVILSFTFDEEEYNYDEEEHSLSSILPVRSGLMRGDLRALYLGWLMAVQEGEIEGDNPYLAAELHKRATTEMRRESKGKPSTRRAAGEIRARAEVIADVRKREEAEQRAREKAHRDREEAELHHCL